MPKTTRFFDEFRKFILRGGVVDLAVGIVIGAAFTNIVNSLVGDIFMPIIGVFTGGFNISGQQTHLYKDAVLRWGNFLQMVLNFVIIGFCLFLVVKAVNALHIRSLIEEASKTPEPTPTERLLGEIRDLLQARESHGDSPPAAPAAG
jgi:large conductance mechanosensitive channel